MYSSRGSTVFHCWRRELRRVASGRHSSGEGTEEEEETTTAVEGGRDDDDDDDEDSAPPSSWRRVREEEEEGERGAVAAEVGGEASGGREEEEADETAVAVGRDVGGCRGVETAESAVAESKVEGAAELGAAVAQAVETEVAADLVVGD